MSVRTRGYRGYRHGMRLANAAMWRHAFRRRRAEHRVHRFVRDWRAVRAWRARLAWNRRRGYGWML